MVSSEILEDLLFVHPRWLQNGSLPAKACTIDRLGPFVLDYYMVGLDEVVATQGAFSDPIPVANTDRDFIDQQR